MLRRLLWIAGRCGAGLRAMFLPAAASQPPARDLSPLVKDEIGRGKQRIAKRVADMQQLTEQEILACGNALSAIFENVRVLMADAESAMTASIDRYEEATARFGSGMREDGRAQEGAVTQVLQLAKGIEGAIGAIDTLTRTSRMLAINTRIEAARIGEQGQAFAVISERMRELGDSISSASNQVKSAMVAMREGIAPVIERAASINARTASFIAELAAHVDTSRTRDAKLRDGRLKHVVDLSQRALCHLQFQDRLQQQLMSINRAVDALDERTGRVLDGEVDLEEFNDVRMPGDGQPGSGAVLLF
ncbi:MAG: methyl-accepting chemotaxis protein [Steroidobacteraceae bacterium]